MVTDDQYELFGQALEHQTELFRLFYSLDIFGARQFVIMLPKLDITIRLIGYFPANITLRLIYAPAFIK
jgi:hypothetical protein